MSNNNNNNNTNQMMKRGEERTMTKYANGNHRNGNSTSIETDTNFNSKVGANTKEKRDTTNTNANTNHFCIVCYNDFTTTRNGKNNNNNNNNSNNNNNNNSIVVLLPCDHNEICSLCHLRIRYLHSDHRCPICKQDNEQIICEYYYKTRFKLIQQQNQQIEEESKDNYDDNDNDNDDENGAMTTTSTKSKSKSNSNSIISTRRFDDYTIWDNNHLGNEYTYCNGQYYNNVGMFFPNEYYTNIIIPILGYHCTIPTCSYTGITTSSVTDIENTTSSSAIAIAIDTSTNSTTDTSIVATTKNNKSNNSTNTVLLQLLHDHLRVEHKLSLCNLCVDNHRDFIARLPRYSVPGLKKHLTIGDGKSFKGHPACQFCTPTRFYDITALHIHLQREHYKCHICEQYDNIPNQYYNNYQSLEKHFDKQHYLCLHPQCLMTRFVVFGNEFDFRYHEKTVHNISIPSNHVDSKIKVEFRVRRTNGTSTSYNSNNNNNNNRYGTSINENDFNFGLDGEAFTNSTSSTQQYSNNQNNYDNNYDNNDPTTWILPMGDDTAPSNNNSQRRNGNGGSGNGSGSAGTVTLHPQHVQRTEELRRQAETIRLEHTRATAFPSLSEANALSTNTNINLPTISSSTNLNNTTSSTSTEDADTGTDTTAVAATATNTGTSTRLMIGDWSSTAHTSNVLARHSSSRRTGAVNDQDFPSLGIGGQQQQESTSISTSAAIGKPKKKQPASASTGSGWAIAASSKPNRYVNGSTIQQQPIQSRPVSTIPISTAYTTTLSPLTNSRNIRTTPTTTTNIVQQPVINSMSDFPSLAGAGTRNGTPSGIPRYDAAQELGKKLASNNTNNNSTGSSSATATGTIATRFSTAAPPPTALNHFPSLPTPAAGTKVKKAGLINALASKKPPPPIQDFKMLTTLSSKATTSSASSATATKTAAAVQQQVTTTTISIDEMKQRMGITQYKTLKRYTSEFVANDITSINFIEACATLFNTGYNDINFWKIIPSLIDSCPNTPLPLSKAKVVAHQYLSQILQQNTSAQIAQENAAIALSTSTSTAASASAKPIQQKPIKNSNLSKVAAAPSSSTSWNTTGTSNKKKW